MATGKKKKKFSLQELICRDVEALKTTPVVVAPVVKEPPPKAKGKKK